MVVRFKHLNEPCCVHAEGCYSFRQKTWEFRGVLPVLDITVTRQLKSNAV